MPYSFGPGNRPSYGQAVTLAPSAERTATGNGSAKVAGASDTARLTLDVTAASGTTPTMTVSIQTSADDSTWTTVASFTQATGTTSQRQVFSGLDTYVRARWVIGGTTPAFTFRVHGSLV